MNEDRTEDEMSWKVAPVILKRRKAAEEQGYDATIRPWSGGWEVFHIQGPGIENGATQACTLDEVEYMVRDYVACTLDLDGEEDDGWDEGVIPVRLTLDLEPLKRTGVRANLLEVSLDGERVSLVEEVTWWPESPEAE